jgi:lipoyl(octanoyl) transferase
MHGFAFNVNTDLEYFKGIIPCGIKDKEVTSLSKELGGKIDLNEAENKIVEKFVEVFDYDEVLLPGITAAHQTH